MGTPVHGEYQVAFTSVVPPPSTTRPLPDTLATVRSDDSSPTVAVPPASGTRDPSERSAVVRGRMRVPSRAKSCSRATEASCTEVLG